MLLPLQINLSKPPAPVSHFVSGPSGGVAYLYQWGTCYALEMGTSITKGEYYSLLKVAERAGARVKFLD